MADVPSAHKFLSLDGLMPSTIFDRGTDMDVSEEMEEVRELLYELIKKKFPMGVASSHLAEKYTEEYVSKGLGRELPSDWLDQIVAAEEFETQVRGPLTIVFVRLSNTSSFKRPSIPLTNITLINTTETTDIDMIKKRKNQYPLLHAEMLSQPSPSLTSKSDVTVVAFDSSEEFYIRAAIETKTFHEIKEDLARFYAEGDAEYRVQIYEILSGGAYALCDAGGDWFRVVAEELPHQGHLKCFFSDVGVRGSFPVRDFRLLPDPHHSIMQIPALAVRVRFGMELACRGERMDDILRQILFENDTMGNLVPVNVQLASLNSMKVKASDGDPSSSEKAAPIADLWTMDGRAIKEVAHDRFIESKENAVSTKVQVQAAPSSMIIAGNCNFVGQPDIRPMELSQMPMGSFPANALFAAGPVDISLRQLSLDPMPDYMYNKLAEECELVDTSLKENPQIGYFYAALIDGRYERVQCVRASKIDKAAYCVYLIDVGAFHYVRKDAMKHLNVRTPFLKMLMFKCKLYGVAPVGGVDVWPPEAHDAVRSFFEAAMGEPVHVQPIGAWSEWKQLNAPTVPLVEAKLSCCGRDLADYLVSCGLAIPTSR